MRLNGLHRLAASASVNVVASVVAAISGVMATGVMARELSVARFGEVLLLLTAVNALAVLEGLRPVVIYRAAVHPEQAGALFRVATRVSVTMMALTVMVLGVAYELGVTRGFGPQVLLFFLGTAAAFFAVMQFWSFLDAEFDTIFTGLARSSAWILTYLAFGVLAMTNASIEVFAFVLCLINVILAFVLLWRFRRLNLQVRYARGGEPIPFGEIAGKAANNILFNLFAVTINLADRAIIGARLGVAQAGLYTGPSEMTLRAGGLVRAAMQVVLPWAVRQSDDASHRLRLWVFAHVGVLMLAGSACVIAIAFRQELTVLLLGPKFELAADLMGIFCIAVVTSTLGYTNMAYLNAGGDFRTQRRHYGAAAVLLLAGAWVGVRLQSIEVVAWAFLLARSVDLVIMAKILLRCDATEQRTVLQLSAGLLLAGGLAWQGHCWLMSAALLLMAFVAGRQLQVLREAT